ncbi:MAG TPA: hydrolase [Longimicrobiaceae bacterium]|nr:hydrolase [Longimicrobiaceae bacterium]
MNLSLLYLKHRIPSLGGTPEEIAERLRAAGIGVKRIVPLKELLADVVVAKVEEVTQHPNADRLKVCVVNDGGEERLQIVTGASNVAAGELYPLIRSGVTLPNGTKIKKGKLRGELSQGMLGSADELELGTDHAGLLTLTGDLTPGTPLPEVMDVPGIVFELEGDVDEDAVLRALSPGASAGEASGDAHLPKESSAADGTLTLNAAETALVLIDLQQGIVAMDTAPHTSAEVVAECAKLADRFRALGASVVLVHVAFAADGADMLKQPVDSPRPGGVPAPGWSDFVPEIGPRDGDLVVTKRQWGAFYGTDLDLQLRRRGVRTIVLGGIATNFGVESTARAAFEHGYAVVLAEDAMASFTADAHRFAISTIFPRVGRTRSTAQVLAALTSDSR